MSIKAAATSTNNRRRASRIEQDFSVSVSTASLGEHISTAHNVSAGGILVDLPPNLPVGTEVTVKFTVPRTKSTFVATGAVKHHLGGARLAANVTATAVEFDDVACD